jgi:hypothetical protein
MTYSNSLDLGTVSAVTELFSYPNDPKSDDTLLQVVAHWVGLSLLRDGMAPAATCSTQLGSMGEVFLTVQGPSSMQSQIDLFQSRLRQFHAIGYDALNTVVPMLTSTGKWDPCPNPSPPVYHPWTFFLPHGMALVNQKAVLFFHYPPIRLLRFNQDYLDDPVPVRCEELLAANGVTGFTIGQPPTGDILLYNTVMDATPIGAEDNQGSKKATDPGPAGTPCPGSAYDPTYGLIPIQSFPIYQKAMVALLLNDTPTRPGYTAPVIVYGAHPLQEFNTIYGTAIKNYAPIISNSIVPGKLTPVLASSHPYVFYGKAQGFDKIGSGIMPPANVPAATAQMQTDLAVSGWVKVMYDDPAQDPVSTWNDLVAFWRAAAQQPTVMALVNHQGSLLYTDPNTLAFTFSVPLKWPT